jgi:hypothetical protein
MRPVRITTRRLMVAVAIAAIVLHPVIGPGPDETSASVWVTEMALVNIPPIVVLPLCFRLGRARLVVAILASASVTVAQFVLRVPPNLYAPVGYLAVAGIAHLARDLRELISGIVAVGCGVLVGIDLGYQSCTAGIELILASLTGIAVKKALCFRGWSRRGGAVEIPTANGER